MVTMPNWQDFKDVLSQSDRAEQVVAWHCTLPFDVEGSVSLTSRFLEQHSLFCLESASQDQRGNGRYSFIGFDPLVTLEINGFNVSVEGPNGTECSQTSSKSSALAKLDDLIAQYEPLVFAAPRARADDVERCRKGGFVGYLAYDQFHTLEPQVPLAANKEYPDLADGVFYLPKNLLILDHYARRLTIVRYTWIKRDSALQSQYAAGARALAELAERVTAPYVVPPLEIAEQPIDWDAFSSSLSEAEFLRIADGCLESIKAGDIYQVQIANRLSKSTAAAPFNVFRHLRMINPSPYMAFYKRGVHHIICASPELMVNVRSGEVSHRPIAGTRKRHWHHERDQQARHELLTSVKERAEHVMLVDLARNDIGRVAVPGSVSVKELMVIEEYSHVFHLVSEVNGHLRKGLTARMALEAGFPNGTVVGAPKIKAAQKIAASEPFQRQFYAGALGVFDFSGGLMSTLMIRTIYMANGVAATQAAAGIVYDSVAKHEWQETRNKMSACLLAIQNTCT